MTTSPDGNWKWDGQNWVPNTAEAASEPPAVPPTELKKSNKWLWIGGGSLAALVLIAALGSSGETVTEAEPAGSTEPTAEETLAPTTEIDKDALIEFYDAEYPAWRMLTTEDDGVSEEDEGVDLAETICQALDASDPMKVVETLQGSLPDDFIAVSVGGAIRYVCPEQGDAVREAQAEQEASSLTTAQENAIRSAESYLSLSAFSRSGLIEQLKFEGYSEDDATLAVDSLDVNWKEQAAKSAERYLEVSSFSRSGLIEQLEFEGYTRAQAEHGADAVGL